MAGAGKGEEIGDVEMGENLEEQLRGEGLEGHHLRGLCFVFGAYLVDCVSILWWIWFTGWDINDEEIVFL